MPGQRIDWRRAKPACPDTRHWEHIPSRDAEGDQIILLAAAERKLVAARKSIEDQGALLKFNNSRLKRLAVSPATDLEGSIFAVVTEPSYLPLKFAVQVFDDLNSRGFFSKAFRFRIATHDQKNVFLTDRNRASRVDKSLLFPAAKADLSWREETELRQILDGLFQSR